MNMGVVVVTIAALGSVILIFYLGYMLWFKPEEYTDGLAKGIKDWMPFANYFRSLYKSPAYLWAMRAGVSFFMAFFAFIFIRMVLGMTGVLP